MKKKIKIRSMPYIINENESPKYQKVDCKQ